MVERAKPIRRTYRYRLAVGCELPTTLVAMSNQDLPFSNGLPLRRMGAILVLVMAVLVWRFIAVDNSMFRILCVGAIIFELVFFWALVLMSRRIRRQYAAATALAGTETAAVRDLSEPDGESDVPGPGSIR